MTDEFDIPPEEIAKVINEGEPVEFGSERERRELAWKHRGEVIPESGRIVEPRRLDQIVSLRLDPDMITRLRDVANLRGVTVSQLIRGLIDGAIWAVFYEDPKNWESVGPGRMRRRNHTFHCQHMSIGPVISAQCQHGCRMDITPVTANWLTRLA